MQLHNWGQPKGIRPQYYDTPTGPIHRRKWETGVHCAYVVASHDSLVFLTVSKQCTHLRASRSVPVGEIPKMRRERAQRCQRLGT